MPAMFTYLKMPTQGQESAWQNGWSVRLKVQKIWVPVLALTLSGCMTKMGKLPNFSEAVSSCLMLGWWLHGTTVGRLKWGYTCVIMYICVKQSVFFKAPYKCWWLLMLNMIMLEETAPALSLEGRQGFWDLGIRKDCASIIPQSNCGLSGKVSK